MKVCNLDTVTAPEDILQLSDVICKEAPLLVIVPAFDWIKRSLQDISIHLFRAEEEKASQAILHLEKRCMETMSGFLPDHGSAFEFAQTQITSNFQHIRQLANSTFSQSDERRLLISGEYISSALIAAYLKSRHIDATVADAATLMHLDADGKPDLETICQQAQAFSQTAQAAVYVTQSLVCQNAYGESPKATVALMLCIWLSLSALKSSYNGHRQKKYTSRTTTKSRKKATVPCSPSKKPRASSMQAFVWYRPAVSRLPTNIRLASV